jgi:hypothetical protein
VKTFILIGATAAITLFIFGVMHGTETGSERLWLICAIKAPGRMALDEIQKDMNAGRYAPAKRKIDVLMDKWRRFDSGPDSFSGPGIGDIMMAFSKLDTNGSNTLPKQEGAAKGDRP